MKTNQWLIPFLEMIKERPASFIGSEDSYVLYTYIFAYAKARTDLGYPPFGKDEETLLSDFTKWLEEKNGILNGDWYTHIKYMDDSSKNIKTFFIFFETFYKTWGASSAPPRTRSDA